MRLGEAVAQEMGPHAVDDGLAQEFALDDQLGQFLAAIDFVGEPLGSICGAVDELGISDLGLAVAQLVEDFAPCADCCCFAGEILVLEPGKVDVLVAPESRGSASSGGRRRSSPRTDPASNR